MRSIKIQLHNDSQQLAFFSRVQLLGENGEEVLPSYWADNYLTLKAGEKQTLSVWIDEHAPVPKAVRVYAWNAAGVIIEIN
jgi:Exo-beta-D-glucosaminidase Ig-fold domain